MNIEGSEDGWMLSFREAQLQMIKIDFRVGMIIADELGASNIYIETPFKVISNDGTASLVVPENAETLMPIIKLIHRHVNRVFASHDGHLGVDFEGGDGLMVAPSDEYESWQMSCGQKMLISGPEGRVSYFVTDSSNS